MSLSSSRVWCSDGYSDGCEEMKPRNGKIGNSVLVMMGGVGITSIIMLLTGGSYTNTTNNTIKK